MTTSAAFEDWVAEARAVTVAAELQRRGVPAVHEQNRPCPAPGCGGVDRFAVNTRKNVWICRASGAGGDAIALCQHIDGTSFAAAVETLTGRPPPGRVAAETEAERQARHARLASAAEEANRKTAEEAIAAHGFREAERRRSHVIWRSGRPIAGTPAESYLRLRGIEPFAGLRLRYLPDAPLWDKPAPHGEVVHQGPVLLAPIVRDGRFAGIHQTWIDLTATDGKARVPDRNGELLPARKVRGSKRGSHIELARGPDAPTRLYMGEGNENVLSVRQALARRRPHLVDGAAFWSAIDLGNLSGKAARGRAHPTLTTVDKNGRTLPQRIAGPVPDREEPAVVLPASVLELVLLGDGDSEPVMTGFAMDRAKARYERHHEGLSVAIAMAPAGRDYNDVLREPGESTPQTSAGATGWVDEGRGAA